MLDTILFDLDGTLLPMDMDLFMKLYSRGLVKKLEDSGFPGTINAVWEATAAMVRNNGRQTNEEVFWDTFSARAGRDVLKIRPRLELFYENEFNEARAATQPNPLARGLVRRLHTRGYTLVLATNPMFPLAAVKTRLSWVGLGLQDFDHVTTYSNSHYCKPNPNYYREILKTLNCPPENCLMVGNDATEDASALQAGISFYLVTDSILNTAGVDLGSFRQGRFATCCRELEVLPVLNEAGKQA